MAEVASPIVDGAAADKKKVDGPVKPEKPDEAEYKKNLAQAEKEHKALMQKLTDVKAKLDIAKPNNKDSPAGKHRNDLIIQLKEIREKQGAGKSGRTKVFEEIKSLDQKIKDSIAQQKVARSRVNFKNVDELDREIDRLQKQVDSGNMKIVDEKKALAEVSNLRKQRKGFSGFEDSQKQIDEQKKKLQTLRDSLEDPESKALSEKYNKIQGELDSIKAEQDDAYKSINSLRDERTKLQNEQQEKYMSIKKIKDDYYQQGRAVQKWEYEARARHREKKKAEDAKYHQEKRKERAQQMLAEASDKAYLDEIRRAESLLRFLDPSYTSEKAPLQAPSQFTATAQRTIDDSGIKGTRVVKKEEEDYFAGTGGKKGKKNKAAKKAESPAPTASAKYNCPPSVLEDCVALKIEPPMTAADVPKALEAVKEKLDFWKKDQAAETERNIAKAKKEVERLDAEDADATNGTPATTGPHANGESKATASVDEGGSVANEIELKKEADEDVAKDLKEASLEDKA